MAKKQLEEKCDRCGRMGFLTSRAGKRLCNACIQFFLRGEQCSSSGGFLSSKSYQRRFEER